MVQSGADHSFANKGLPDPRAVYWNDSILYLLSSSSDTPKILSIFDGALQVMTVIEKGATVESDRVSQSHPGSWSLL